MGGGLGGLFLYKNENELILGITPKFNMAIRNKGHVPHSVTMRRDPAPHSPIIFKISTIRLMLRLDNIGVDLDMTILEEPDSETA
jgi:hypothetical protein